MSRIIENEYIDNLSSNEFGIAKFEDVNQSELERKFKKRLEEKGFVNDTRTTEEIQWEFDKDEAIQFLDFFELSEDDIDLNSQDVLKDLAESTFGSADENLEEIDKNIEVISNEDAQSVEQLTEFSVDDDDPLLIKEHEEMQKRIVTNKLFEREKVHKASEQPTESDPFRTKESYSSNPFQESERTYRSAATGSYKSEGTSPQRKVNVTTQTVYDHEKRAKETADMYARGADKVLKFVYNGPRPEKQPRRKRRGKFSFKYLGQDIKNWFRTKNARVLFKMGLMITLDAVLAIVTKRYEFEGPKQALSYIAMMMSIFYMGRELAAEGFDARFLMS